MIPILVFISVSNVCPVEKSMECCVSCQAKYLVCQDKSDSLIEDLTCLRQKKRCQGECPVDGKNENGGA